MVIVTVPGAISITGADIRPVAGDPLEQARSQTRMKSRSVPGFGEGKAGSSAHVARPNSGDSSPVAAGSASGDTGHGEAGRAVVWAWSHAAVAAKMTKAAPTTLQRKMRS